jgi:hypothetical protein
MECWFVFLGGAGIETEGFVLAKQALYHLVTAPVHFHLVVFAMGSHTLFAWAALEL